MYNGKIIRIELRKFQHIKGSINPPKGDPRNDKG